MKLLLTLEDNQYPRQKITHKRKIVRAILIDEHFHLALTKIKADDMFGHRDYYELPGGGLKKIETHRRALKRELKEELGAEINNQFVPLGRVVDYYNLIQRKNDQHYYICFLKSLGENHLEKRESELIEKIVWVNIDEAISLYETMQNELVGALVKQRELPILKLAKAKIALLKDL